MNKNLIEFEKDVLISILFYLRPIDLLKSRLICKFIEEFINNHFMKQVIIKNTSPDLEAAYHRGSRGLLHFFIKQDKVIENQDCQNQVRKIDLKLSQLNKRDQNTVNHYNNRRREKQDYAITAPDVYNRLMNEINNNEAQDINTSRKEKDRLESSKELLIEIINTDDSLKKNKVPINLLQKLKLIDNKVQKKDVKPENNFFSDCRLI